MKIDIRLREYETAECSCVALASQGSEAAKKKGLTHAGFGRYKDKSGKVTHRIVDGKLVPVGGKGSSKKTGKSNTFYGKHADTIDRAHIKKHKAKVIEDTAAAGHKQWQADFKKANGKDATRMKKTKDEAWIKKHGAEEVDIANTKYADLPDDWKKENLESAKSAVDGLLKSKGSGAAAADKAASYVHDKWLERNGSWAPEHQKLPFNKLTKDEQDKDRFFVVQALKNASKIK